MSHVAAASPRIRAFAWDYLIVLGYLLALLCVGLFLTLGPTGTSWTAWMANPWRADLVAFVLTVFPVTLYFALSEASGSAATWGKRRVGLAVARIGTNEGPGPGRALLRNALKFLPWQMAHTAMFHIPGFPATTVDPPGWTVVVLSVAWLLVALYLLGLTRLGGHRPPYDRLAGTAVVAVDAATAGGVESVGRERATA